MPPDPVVAIDVLVPNPAPSVDVLSVGVQGPPGAPGPAGPQGEPGEPGPPGEGAGPHAASHYVGGADALAGSLAATDVRVGVNPSQSGAVRLANNQSISARNAANSADLPLLRSDNVNGTIIGSQTGGNTNIDSGGGVLVQGAGGIKYDLDAYGIYPSPDATRNIGHPNLRWKQANISESVNVGQNPAQSRAVRLANNQSICWRNSSNSGDTPALRVEATDAVVLEGAYPTIRGLGAYGVLVEPFLRLPETTGSPVPVANQANLYLEDNGAGKSLADGALCDGRGGAAGDRAVTCRTGYRN